jgi:hypothetical protein
MQRFLAICLLVTPALGCTLEYPGYKYIGPSPNHPHMYLYRKNDPPYDIEEFEAPIPVPKSTGLERIFVPI